MSESDEKVATALLAIMRKMAKNQNEKVGFGFRCQNTWRVCCLSVFLSFPPSFSRVVFDQTVFCSCFDFVCVKMSGLRVAVCLSVCIVSGFVQFSSLLTASI